MGIIKERKNKYGIVFERYDSIGDIIQEVGSLGFIMQSRQTGFTYFMIMDLDGNLIEEANYYLNKIISGNNYKKRELAYSALKLFYAFIRLFHLEVDDEYKKSFTSEHLDKLKVFLEGGKYEGNLWTIEFETTRTNNTKNAYMGVYRDFYKTVFRATNNALFDKSISGGNCRKTVKYRISQGTAPPTEVPMYITPEEYDKITSIVEKHYGIREKIIIGLMYDYGLRIGETLGLTLEDIDETGDPKLIIRNRVSDKPYQMAKGVMKVKSTSDYKQKAYQTYEDGYQTIPISEEMKELIEEYIDDSRDAFLLNSSVKKMNNLNTFAIADYIGTKPLTNNENQYIFLSKKRYVPLPQSGWNFVLRKIFEAAGIILDKGVRNHNLNHRLRHGFAMKKVLHEGYTIERLQLALRHRNSTSVMIYFRPTQKEKARILKQNVEYRSKKGTVNFGSDED